MALDHLPLFGLSARQTPTMVELAGVKRPSARKAIRLRCLDCVDTKHRVKSCVFDGKQDVLCPIHQFRRGPNVKAGRGSRLKAIRRYCLWCMNGSQKQVRLCEDDECPLFLYRFGRRPKK